MQIPLLLVLLGLAAGPLAAQTPAPVPPRPPAPAIRRPPGAAHLPGPHLGIECGQRLLDRWRIDGKTWITCNSICPWG